MKIKGLLLGMLAYAAMVACTNEDIVKNNVNQPEKVKGNLSLVISSTSNSSRAADNEESGVTDPGIEGESTVTDAVIILNRLDENGNLTKEEFGGYLTKAQLNDILQTVFMKYSGKFIFQCRQQGDGSHQVTTGRRQ